MQRLREEIEHLQERFGESVTELDTRTTFMKKTIKVRWLQAAFSLPVDACH
jgi:hypothetical protein